MEKLDKQTNEDRIISLEKQLKVQNARIDALTSSVALLVLAQVVSHDDARVPNVLGEYCTSNLDAARDGGTERISAQFFADKGAAFAELLKEVRQSSDFLSRYWFRSVLPWRDARRLQRINTIRAAIERICDRVGI
jgi:hypothetical protein